MNLEPMRYKDFVWPHNPKSYEIVFARKLAAQKVPFGRYYLQNLGMTCRVLRGEGEFSGPGAYDAFKRLATLFYDETPGILVHPVWQTASAYFTALSLKMAPYEDYVNYTFEFWEDYGGYTGTAQETAAEAAAEPEDTSAAGARTYTVCAGDTLWDIARRSGLSLETLIALNPQIRNPNLIYAGDTVNLA